MGANLIESLHSIRDFRAAQGRRYPLWLILLLIIMGPKKWKPLATKLQKILGCATTKRSHEKLGLSVTRLPSDTTSRRILHRLDFHLLAEQFQQWANSTFHTSPSEWVSIDGKSIRGTVTGSQTAYQNFVSLVSFYSSQQGIVLAARQERDQNYQ